MSSVTDFTMTCGMEVVARFVIVVPSTKTKTGIGHITPNPMTTLLEKYIAKVEETKKSVKELFPEATLNSLDEDTAWQIHYKDAYNKGISDIQSLLPELIKEVELEVLRDVYNTATLYSDSSFTLLHSYLERRYPEILASLKEPNI